jgi:hypothetical protein
MKTYLFLFAACIFFSCSSAGGKPTKADVEKALRTRWDKPATSMEPKQSITIQSIKIGSGAIANERDLTDGIPPKAMVTMVQIEFTARQFYNDQTMVTRRVMIAKVYKDQFGEWVVMSNGMKTQETKYEPKA